MVLLAETKALHPETKRPVPARVVERDGAVFLEKLLGAGRTQCAEVERSADFYRRYSDPEPAGRRRILNRYVYVTSRCNLKCTVCYERVREPEEPPRTALLCQLAKLKGSRILLCGAEPTCRGDLPDIIRPLRQHNAVLLMTNGVRLADMKYLRSLQEAGLRSVILAFNGLNDDVYRRTNGEPLLDVKLKALENLSRLGSMAVYLSMTVTRGVNEDQIRPVIEFAGGQPCVLQVRLRSMTEVGHYLAARPFCLSEFLRVVCRETGMDYDLWLRQQDFLDHVGRAFGIDRIRPKLCAMKGDIDKDFVPLASERDWRAWDAAVAKRPRLAAHLVRAWGPSYALRYILGWTGRPSYASHPRVRRISLRVWPGPDTLDLGFSRRCMSLYYRDGKALPFCLCNILRNT